MHARRRLELIIEHMALRRACDILEEAGMTGYTVMSASSGYGGGSHWRRDGDISNTREMAIVVSICDVEKINAALEALHELLDEQIGVLSVSNVEVLRPDRF